MDSRDGHWLGAWWRDATARVPLELVSPLKREEVERRLKDAIDTEWTLFGSKPVVGKVDDHSFRLRCRILYRNSFQTVVSGTLSEEGRKTRLRCQAGAYSFLYVFLAAWFAAISVGAATFAWVMLMHADEVAGQLPLIVGIGVAVSVGMLVFGVGLVSLGRWFARNERQQLITFLERTIEAKVVG